MTAALQRQCEVDYLRQVNYGCWALCGFAGCRPSVRTVELLRTPRGEDAARSDLSGRLPPSRLQGAAGEEKILYHPSGTGSMQRPLLNEYARNTSSALKSKKTVADDADGYNPEIDPHTESDVRLLKILASRGNGESGRDSFVSRQGLSDIEQGVLSKRILTKLAQQNLSHTVFSGFARFRRSFSIGPLNLVNGVCCDSQCGQQLPVRRWRPGAGPREHYQSMKPREALTLHWSTPGGPLHL
ncbi:hypothetical protein CMUS01_05214 [Colletotrichum musicola]|uniref:Uncharacterized protein n=1 Tax=Colletotrichum musicola TaxID=2175873 RepID=A0A8H6KTN9_9PEZI|nr:hypothetical protein CMUS01_05214 [Colletotrichum musicola]